MNYIISFAACLFAFQLMQFHLLHSAITNKVQWDLYNPVPLNTDIALKQMHYLETDFFHIIVMYVKCPLKMEFCGSIKRIGKYEPVYTNQY